MHSDSDATLNNDGDPARLVPAVDRAVRILDIVSSSPHGLKLAEIIRRSGLPKSSVHGLCQTLTSLNLLQLAQDGSYAVGSRSMRWSNAFLDQNNIVSVFQRVLEQQPALHAYTVTLSRLEQGEVVYIACRNASTPLGITFRLGMRLPALFTATGKAMLAAMPTASIANHLPDVWPEPLTPTGVMDRSAFERELAAVRQLGYSIDNGQLREGMYCIGSAITDHQGQPVAGVAMSMTAMEARGEALDQAGKQIMRLAHHIAHGMGWA